LFVVSFFSPRWLWFDLFLNTRILPNQRGFFKFSVVKIRVNSDFRGDIFPLLQLSIAFIPHLAQSYKLKGGGKRYLKKEKGLNAN